VSACLFTTTLQKRAQRKIKFHLLFQKQYQARFLNQMEAKLIKALRIAATEALNKKLISVEIKDLFFTSSIISRPPLPPSDTPNKRIRTKIKFLLFLMKFIVTEQEIYNGILNNQSKPDERSIVFFREFNDYETVIGQNQVNKMIKKYFELQSDGSLDTEVNALLISLKNKLEKLDEGNLIHRMNVIRHFYY
jgi:hypothetical protein